MSQTKKEQEYRVPKELTVEISMIKLQELADVVTNCFKQVLENKEILRILRKETGRNPIKLPVAVRLVVALGEGEFRVEEMIPSPGDDIFWSSRLLLDMLSCDDYGVYFEKLSEKWFYKSYFLGDDPMRPSLGDFRREGIAKGRQPITIVAAEVEKQLVCEWNLMVPLVLAGEGYIPGRVLAKGSVLNFGSGISTVNTGVYILP